MKRSSWGFLPFQAVLLMLLLLPGLFAPGAYHSPNCRHFLTEAVRPVNQPQDTAGMVANCLPWRADLWESAAHQALESGKAETALHYLEQIWQAGYGFEGRPESTLTAQGLSDLASAYLLVGDYTAALKTWQAYAAHSGLTFETGELIARLHLTQGEIPAAVAVWQALCNQFPQDARAHFQLGLLLATQDPEAALLPLEQAVQLDPALGETVSKIRRSVLSARLAEDPAVTLLSSGRALAALGEWYLAAEAFRQAILHQPHYADAWAYLGEALQHLPGAMPKSASEINAEPPGWNELQTALNLDPGSLAAQAFMALYWLRQGEYPQAQHALEQALELSDQNPVLLAELANIQAISGDLDGAFATYWKAASQAPYDPFYLRQMVRFSLEFNYQVEGIALPVARRLLIEGGDDPINLDLMAQVMIQRGDLSNAERFLGRALQRSPKFAPAHLHLGLIYLLRGDPRSASEYLRLAHNLDPAGETGVQALRLLNSANP